MSRWLTHAVLYQFTEYLINSGQDPNLVSVGARQSRQSSVHQMRYHSKDIW